MSGVEPPLTREEQDAHSLSQRGLVLAAAARLRARAGWNAEDVPWRYARDNEIRHIRFAGDWSGYDSVPNRIRHAVEAAWSGGRRRRNFYAVWAAIKVNLSTEAHRPDGVVGEGRIITFWEEDGEYLELVSPQVGILLAGWMTAAPDDPHARAIAELMTPTKEPNDA